MKSPFAHALILLLSFTSSLLHAQSPRTEAPQADKAAVASIEDRWLKAIEAFDAGALNSILAEDFIRPAPTAGRFITKSQYLSYFKSHPGSQSKAAKRIENLQVTIYGNTAIARGVVIASDAQGHPISKNLFTDVFVKRSGQWQAVSAQENSVSENSHAIY